MKLWLEPHSLDSKIQVPSSKSLSNRYLILGALKDDFLEIKNISKSDDTNYLVKALELIGCSVIENSDSLKIKGPFPQNEKAIKDITYLQVGEGGTTARFLAPLLALGKNPYILKMHGNLSERPWEELIVEIKRLGAQCELRGDGLFIHGPILLGDHEVQIDCSRSSQFASAMALALSSSKLKISTNNLNSSKPYWEMTQEVLKNKNQQQVTIASDWSSAAPLMALSAIKGYQVIFENLYFDSLQADSILGSWLKNRSALKYLTNGVEVSALRDLSPFEIDVRNHQDLFPVWSYLASHMNGISLITGIDGLRYKETDRVASVLNILDQLNVKYQIHDGKLEISGTIKLERTLDLVPAFDHRIVMMASIFLATHQGGCIHNSETVRKSYPGFFDNFKTTESNS